MIIFLYDEYDLAVSISMVCKTLKRVKISCKKIIFQFDFIFRCTSPRNALRVLRKMEPLSFSDKDYRCKISTKPTNMIQRRSPLCRKWKTLPKAKGRQNVWWA